MTFLLRTRRWRTVLGTAAALPLLLLLCGCRPDPINVYRVPKEKVSEHASGPGSGHGGRMGPRQEPASLSEVKWTTPEGWEEAAASGLRVARFTVKSPAGVPADISIIPLASLQGRDFEIVNLWRSELKLAPATPAELEPEVEKVTVAGEAGRLFDLVSTEVMLQEKFKGRILAALVPHAGSTWCFKLAGEDAHVTSLKAAFAAFLGSIRFEAPSMTAAAAAAPAPGGPGVGDGGAAPARPTWEVPAGWSEQPAGSMVLAKFVATGEAGAKVEITVSAFPGDVGGLVANVNRWRDQLSLPAVSAGQIDAMVTRVDAGGRAATMVDLNGTEKRSGQPSRMLGAIVPHAGQTWFYKLVGSPQVAAREKEAFTKFVQSVRYPNG